MKKITPEEYVDGVRSIYVEQPSYDKGCDGSNGKCDCIGMVRGALKRKGITDISGMNGTNYALRHKLQNVQKIKKVDQLRVGDVVLKFRDKDDASMQLPDQYRKGGNDYSATWGEMNCTHIGTVTSVNPLEITHMTSPTAKIDTSLGKWTYFGQLPWVDYAEEPEESAAKWVRVWADSGKTVKMRAKPSRLCRTYWDVPIGSEVILMNRGNDWSEIIWAGRTGYMMTKFLKENNDEIYTVTIKNLNKEQAEAIIQEWGGTMTVEGDK